MKRSKKVWERSGRVLEGLGMERSGECPGKVHESPEEGPEERPGSPGEGSERSPGGSPGDGEEPAIEGAWI